MALIIRKKIKMAILSFLIVSGVIFGFTLSSVMIPFSDYSVEFSVTTLMYVLTLFGIAWHSLLDTILHNLFSKQLVVVESKSVNKFHIKNSISFSVWCMSLMWASLLFIVITTASQVSISYYPVYILVFTMFYTIMSIPRISWKRSELWWVYDILFAVAVNLLMPILTTGLYILVLNFY